MEKIPALAHRLEVEGSSKATRKTPKYECNPRGIPSTTKAIPAINQGVGEKRMMEKALSCLTETIYLHKAMSSAIKAGKNDQKTNLSFRHAALILGAQFMKALHWLCADRKSTRLNS